MLRSVHELTNYVLSALDGEIGRCKDFLFDSERWALRYLIADTGKWIPRRKVLVSPVSLGHANHAERRLHVHLTRAEIEAAPPLGDGEPITRSHEVAFARHYGFPFYWAGASLWGFAATPYELRQPEDSRAPEPSGRAFPPRSSDDLERDSNIYSVGEVLGFRVAATDGDLGGISDFIVDDDTWALDYVVVDTHPFWPGRRVLLAPSWIRSLDWHTKRAAVDLTRKQVEGSPPFDPAMPVNRRYEERLYDYYGRPAPSNR
jgi:sirohydrochlorin ferrochelatase